MVRKMDLTLVAQPQDFFRELVTGALGRQQIAVKPETEFYLVNLLGQFITTDRLYSTDQQGGVREESLALMLKEAYEAQPPIRTKLFRRIGDVSLYVGGYFQQSLNRKVVDVDYYIEIGGRAYGLVAGAAEEPAHRSVYEELAGKFKALIDVLAEVSDQTQPRTEKDLLRLYELWVRTRSDRAAKALKEAGILPNDTIKKTTQ
jgi:hypothetical protein